MSSNLGWFAFDTFISSLVFVVLYLINLRRRFTPFYIFIMLIIFLPGVFALLIHNQPLLFHSYKGMEKIVDMADLPMEHRRNLIVVYVESFNKSYQSIVYENKKYTLDDGDAVHFKYFKEGVEQNVTIAALKASLTGVFPSYYFPGGDSISRLTAAKGYQNLFVKEGWLSFANTLHFLKDEGFVDENVYGWEKIEDNSLCNERSYRIYGKAEAEKHLSWWVGAYDEVGFELFKQKILKYDANTPFFAILFTLDLHSGYNPYFVSKDEIKAQNIVNLNSFIQWYRKQKFYPNTTLIILADHAEMGTVNKEGEPLYNAFFNLPPNLLKDLNTDRTFNQADMYATMLEILGFKLPFSQIGFSTSLFSKEPTIEEKYHDDVLDESGDVTDLIKKSKNLWILGKEVLVALVENLKKNF